MEITTRQPICHGGVAGFFYSTSLGWGWGGGTWGWGGGIGVGVGAQGGGMGWGTSDCSHGYRVGNGNRCHFI